jgi:hypothetical protein
MISISKDLLKKIFETKKFQKEYKYDVASYIDMTLKQFPTNLKQEELETKLKEFVLQYLSKSDLEEAQQSYLDEYGLDAINVMTMQYIVSFLRSNPESTIVLDAEVFCY